MAAMDCKRDCVVWLAALSLCQWGLSLPLFGQNCSITGYVLDPRRGAVATAVVTVTQVDSGSTRQILSNSQGFFQLASLPPGEYRIDAVKPGFKPLSHIAVELGRSLAATMDLQMENAEVSGAVTLEARKTSAGSLLAYICGLSVGSGCETIEPVISAQTDSPFLP
jgi:Carboxypeptidase regulatory-like domain